MPPDDAQMYYRTEITKLSVREIWRLSSSLRARITSLILHKVLGVSLPVTFGIARGTLRFLHLDELPFNVSAATQGLSQHLRTEGFLPFFIHKIDSIGTLSGWSIDFLDQEGIVWAVIAYVHNASGDEVSVTLATKRTDGRILSTTNACRRLNVPAGIEPIYSAGASVCDLTALHYGRLRRLPSGDTIELDEARLPALIEEISNRTFEMHLNRGVFVELTENEVAALQRKV